MSLFSKLSAVPPVFAPNRYRDVFSAFFGEGPKSAVEQIREHLGRREVLLFDSGRAAMVAALRAMREMRHKTEVVIPAYTCYTVPSAVAAAGLKFIPCDIDRKSFNLSVGDLRKVLSEKTLCVVPAHLYGIPCRIEEILDECRKKDIWVFEDSAQSLGGWLNLKVLGGFGDLSVYSLGRGKNLNAGGGGILSIRDPELAEGIRESLGGDFCRSQKQGWKALADVLAMQILARPPFYGPASMLPGVEIGVSRFDRNISVAPLSKAQTNLLSRIFGRIEELRIAREHNADWYRQCLRPIRPVSLPEQPTNGRSAHLRFPILVPAEKRDEILHSAGERLGMSPSYPKAVDEIPEAEAWMVKRSPCKNARAVASRVLTLPTHPRVTERIREAILDCLGRLQ